MEFTIQIFKNISCYKHQFDNLDHELKVNFDANKKIRPFKFLDLIKIGFG